MFEQSPFLGPGSGSVTNHTAEILLLLAVAFLLGFLLKALLTRGLAKEVHRLSHKAQSYKEKLAAAEQRPKPKSRLRESTSSEHERTLKQLRESREAEARARERIIELEGRLALLEAEAPSASDQEDDPLAPVLPFVTATGKKGRQKS